jgi:hypothetical protein
MEEFHLPLFFKKVKHHGKICGIILFAILFHFKIQTVLALSYLPAQSDV